MFISLIYSSLVCCTFLQVSALSFPLLLVVGADLIPITIQSRTPSNNIYWIARLRPGWCCRIRVQAAVSAGWGADSAASTWGVRLVYGRGWWWQPPSFTFGLSFLISSRFTGLLTSSWRTHEQRRCFRECLQLLDRLFGLHLPWLCHLLLLGFGGFLLRIGSGGDLGVSDRIRLCLMMLGLLVLDECEPEVERVTVMDVEEAEQHYQLTGSVEEVKGNGRVSGHHHWLNTSPAGTIFTSWPQWTAPTERNFFTFTRCKKEVIETQSSWEENSGRAQLAGWQADRQAEPSESSAGGTWVAGSRSGETLLHTKVETQENTWDSELM